jgi:hypothetical protein
MISPSIAEVNIAIRKSIPVYNANDNIGIPIISATKNITIYLTMYLEIIFGRDGPDIIYIITLYPLNISLSKTYL